MAEPITFYQQGAAAGQQVDKYSTNPGCVDSKNLDIFSDSQAIKGMAWSEGTAISDDWVDFDKKGRFYLASDGRVWDSVNNVWYDHSYFDENANTISYNGITYAKAVFGTPKKLWVAYDSNGNWKTISILTDRLIYNIYSDWIHIASGSIYGIRSGEQTTRGGTGTGRYTTVEVAAMDNLGENGVSFSCEQNDDCPGGFHTTADLSEKFMRCKFVLKSHSSAWKDIELNVWKQRLIWDKVKKAFDYNQSEKIVEETISSLNSGRSITREFFFDNVGTASGNYTQTKHIYIHASTSSSGYGVLGCAYYKKEDWQYFLPKDKNVLEIEDDIYVEIDETEYEQYSYYALEDYDGNTYYQLTQVNTLNLPDDTQIAAFARGFDFQYCFANKGDLGIVYYMTDVNLATWDVGWRFPGTKFINALLIGNYAYVIAEKRGVRGLYIFSQGDMKLLVGADKRYTESDSLIEGKEIYNFTGIMANWRDRVVCATDNTVFMWGRNKLGANVGAFVLTVDGTITKIDTKRGYLDVYYTNNNTEYRKSIQDDVNIVDHESEWSVTYPVQINTHLIEKEPMKMEVSYNLPNGDTSLDVFINVNDYYFWTFESDSDVELEEGDKFKLVGCGGDYRLIFVEKNQNSYTFYLDGDLPYQVNNTKQIISENENTTINFTALNHFKHIDTCTKDSEYYPEGKYTILNITNRNKLPVVRKMQVKVVGTNAAHSTPELYAIRLLSNQFDK